jgi:hypothetical protein
VAQVQRRGDVGRGNDDGVGLAGVSGLGVEGVFAGPRRAASASISAGS